MLLDPCFYIINVNNIATFMEVLQRLANLLRILSYNNHKLSKLSCQSFLAKRGFSGFLFSLISFFKVTLVSGNIGLSIRAI